MEFMPLFDCILKRENEAIERGGQRQSDIAKEMKNQYKNFACIFRYVLIFCWALARSYFVAKLITNTFSNIRWNA